MGREGAGNAKIMRDNTQTLLSIVLKIGTFRALSNDQILFSPHNEHNAVITTHDSQCPLSIRH